MDHFNSLLRKVEHEMDVYNAWDKVTAKSLSSVIQAGDSEHLNLSSKSPKRDSLQKSTKSIKKKSDSKVCALKGLFLE